MKKIYIIHGWDFTPESNWYSWLKSELEIWRDQAELINPAMPNKLAPVIENWVNYLKQVIPNPDKETYFVGHSIGCQTIMRCLETFENVKIGGALFVAGWLDLKNLEGEEVEKIAEPWLKTPINFEKAKKQIGYLKVILSDNDPYNCLEENSKIFKEKLGASVYVEEKAGHFTGNDYPRILTETLDVLGIFVKLPTQRM